MTHKLDDFEPALAELEREDWFSGLEALAEEHGYYEPLGDKHVAAFIDAGPCLLVTFESFDEIVEGNRNREPRGFSMVRQHGWSHLSIISNGPSWFRESRVYRYFDRLVDDGFFEDFEQVLFYGVHRGGYAATAFSVAAPGARILALRPVATLDPKVAFWDGRYRSDRRLNFNDRYGYAPDMIEAAAEAFVVFDPYETLDAMHGSLFNRPNATHLRTVALGDKVETGLDTLKALEPLMLAAMEGELNPQLFGEIYRPRHQNVPYLRMLLALTERQNKYALAKRICDHVLSKKDLPFFARRKEIAETKLRAVEPETA